MQAADPTTSQQRPRAPRSLGIILAIACIGQFMVILDVAIVNVALPAMRDDLGLSVGQLQWVVNAYVLTFAGSLLLGGRAADLFGARRIFLLGVGVFTLTSLIGGAAPNGGVLVAARAVQGLGAAILAPATLTIVMTSFEAGPSRHRAIGVWASMATTGGAAGALLGGTLTTFLSWRWIFFINIPIGLVLLAGGWRWLVDATVRTVDARLDVAGAITATAGLACLVYAIIGTEARSWTDPVTVALLAASAVLLSTFLFIEARVAAHPLMPLRLFKSRSVWGADLVMLLVGGMFITMWFFLSLILQTGMGYSAVRTGIATSPLAFSAVLSAQASARLIHGWGTRRVLVVGTLATFLGFVGFSRLTADSTYFPDVVLPGLLATIGLGFTFPALTTAATNRIPAGDVGVASGLLQTSRQVGGALGLAVLGAAAVSVTGALAGGADPTPSQLSAGYARAFAIGAGVTAVGAVVALLVPRAELATADEAAPQAASEVP